jgi:hypothetical protein
MFIYVNWLTYVRVPAISITVIYMVKIYTIEWHNFPLLSHFLLHVYYCQDRQTRPAMSVYVYQ